MTVAFDAFSSVAAGTGELSWTHTPVGTPRAATVQIIQNVGATDEVTGVTYGGTPMTEVAGSPNILVSGETGAIYTYFLGASVPTDAQTVVVSVNGTGSTKRAAAITQTAADDCEVVDSDGTINSTSQSNPSVTLSLSGRTSFAAIAFNTGRATPTGITPLANWTDRLEHDWGEQSAGWYTYDIIGSTDVMAGWGMSVAEDVVAVALAVSEEGIGGDEGPIKAPVFNPLFAVISDMIDWTWSRDKKRRGKR